MVKEKDFILFILANYNTFIETDSQSISLASNMLEYTPNGETFLPVISVFRLSGVRENTTGHSN